jgi:glycolate oxidase FAD binding subunit
VTLKDVEIDGVVPRHRVSPSSADQLADALKIANQNGQSVVPIGGGTQLDLGMPPERIDLAIETTALDRVVEYEPADLTVTVETGMRFAELQALLAKQGQFLALDPPAQDGATIGGLLATNASGPLRYAYGSLRDLVLGTRIANPDGTVTHAGGRVVKNVAGYDLNKLYVGSLGTLGILVEVSFKVAPIPPALNTVVGQFGTLDRIGSVVDAVVHSALSPMAIEVLGPGAATASGLPPGDLVVFRIGGYPQAVERQVRDLAALIVEHGGRHVDAPEVVWRDIARSRIEEQQRDLVLKAAVPLSESTRLVAILEQRLRDLDPIVWAHAGNGVAYAACNSPPSDLIGSLRREISALGSNASLIVQRCPAVLKRTIDVWGDPGSSIHLMRSLKTQLDPRNTLNPGRYVGGI